MNLDSFKKYIKTDNKLENSKTNNDIWCYTRVSSKEQFNNNSLDNQKEDIIEFAKKNGYNITHTMGGTYESASGDFTRKEFTKLIEKIKSAKNKPFGIAIRFIARFSRTGGNAVGIASNLIENLGVHLIETSSGLTTVNEADRLIIYEKLIDSKRENLVKLERTIPGMITFIKKGNWLGKAPLGYQIHGSRVTNEKYLKAKQEIVITNEGELLKKAWLLKLEGEPDFKIRKYLESLGLNITKQKMSAMWRNPFYCGVSTHKFLEGTPIKGNWEPIVSRKNFEKINNANNGKRDGYKVSKYHEGRPLQSHLYCGSCGSKLSGYKAKKIYDYYKCLNKKCKSKDLKAMSGVKGKPGVNNLFIDFLKRYELSDKFINAFKKQTEYTINSLEEINKSDDKLLTKRKKEIKTRIDSLTDKFLDDLITNDIYQNKKVQLEGQLDEINIQIEKASKKISNLNKKIEKCTETVKNISKYYSSGSLSTKHKVQKLVFPEGLVIDSKKWQYRTKKVNLVFASIPVITRDNSSKTKNSSSDLDDESCLVAGAGLSEIPILL
ncbi:recombinase family protein [Pseudofulvibacter geojedonensis]|uniref:Recombinase family protein n=1 Tax=Pseudofulvibacter geojedonensis TaxID=1123758 RepID=A0ABW3I314_9FLAO